MLLTYLMNFLMCQKLILIHLILISMPIPSAILSFQLKHQFKRIWIPIPSPFYFLAGISVQPDLNHNPINQGPADVSNDNSIGTPSNNLPLRESTNILKNGPKKKRARTHVKKSERNAKKYPVFSPYKESCSKRCITNFSSDDRAFINSRCKFDVNNKTNQQKGSGWLSSREYLLPLKDGKCVVLYKSMFLSILGLKSGGMITDMVRAQRQRYDDAIAPTEGRRGRHPSLNECDAEVIRLHINSYNPAMSHYKRKNALYKWYLNPDLSIKEIYKNFSENK